ncbi:MAG TPA: GGDEF domain-containing protein [Candidatus Udaeobacter sp.]|nr:GGDEF domain-containing protein [Candidatus Udaeobacter sp.]
MASTIYRLFACLALDRGEHETEARWLTHVLTQLVELTAAERAFLLRPGPQGTFEEIGLRAGDETLARIRRDASPWPELIPPATGGPERHERRILECGEPRAMLVAPLELPHGHGALGLERPAAPEAPILLAASAGVLAAAAMNRHRMALLEAEAVTDELTQVHNYRFLRQALDREVQRAARYGHWLSILMIDVDHLKGYNDRFGHLAGSQVLKSLARVLRTATRDIDLIAKYGGDEFLIILPHTGLDGAQSAAERLRAAVASTTFPPLTAGEMTCSIGIAVFPGDGRTPETMLAAADEALFAAKRTGRNRVVQASDPSPRLES